LSEFTIIIYKIEETFELGKATDSEKKEATVYILHLETEMDVEDARH